MTTQVVTAHIINLIDAETTPNTSKKEKCMYTEERKSQAYAVEVPIKG